VSLVFGANGDGGTYARALGDPAVFVVAKVLRDLASRPAVDRSRLRLDPNALGSLTLVRGSTHLVLERSGEHLVRQGREGRAPHDDDKLETALAEFYAQVAVHTGPPAPDEGMDHPTLEIVARRAAVDARPSETRITVGAPARVDPLDVYLARASGLDATFAVPRRAVNGILDAW
jgi:hypothetical protein